MDEEATSEDPERQGRQRWADELAAARNALEEARRQAARSAPGTEEPTEAFDPARVAYEMELAEHRSTTERAHRAELAARDLTIGYQQERIDRTNAVLVGLFRKSLAEGGKATKSASPEGPASAYSIRGEASIARSRTVIGLTNSGLLRLRSEGPVSSCPPTCLALLELLA
jgi:hypothetical protein